MASWPLVSAWKRWRAGILATIALHCSVVLALAYKLHDAHPIAAPPSFAVEMVSAPPAAEPRPEAPPERSRSSQAPETPMPPIARQPPAPSEVALPPPMPQANRAAATAALSPAPPAPPPASAVAIAPPNRIAASSVDPKAQASWEADVMARLEAAKRYPASARFAHEEATIQVQFEVDRSGRVVRSKLLHPSGKGDLDDEVLSLLRRVRLPPPPSIIPAEQLRLTVPIEFSINRD